MDAFMGAIVPAMISSLLQLFHKVRLDVVAITAGLIGISALLIYVAIHAGNLWYSAFAIIILSVTGILLTASLKFPEKTIWCLAVTLAQQKFS